MDFLKEDRDYKFKIFKDNYQFFRLNCDKVLYPLVMKIWKIKGSLELYVSWNYKAPSRDNYEIFKIAEPGMDEVIINPTGPHAEKSRFLYFSFANPQETGMIEFRCNFVKIKKKKQYLNIKEM